MMNKVLIFTFLLCMFSACTDNNEDNTIIDVDIDEISDSSIRWGLKSFQAIADNPLCQNENLTVSPISLQAALYMALNGAQNNTESEMAETLELGEIIPNDHNAVFNGFINKLLEGNEITNLNMANSVFFDPDKISLASEFQSQLEEHYQADFIQENFLDPATVDIINNWAKENTEGRIEEIIENIRNDEVMFIINALYFSGDWIKGFSEYMTREDDFNLSTGRSR